MAESVIIIKEGWVTKRAEYLKTWRARYFVLMSDGSFVGYKERTYERSVKSEVYNNFNICRAQVIKVDRPKLCLQLRFFHDTTPYTRLFRFENLSQRDEWYTALMDVSLRLSESMKYTEPASPSKTLEDFKLLKVLGKGTFGQVFLGREKETNEVCAIKILQKWQVINKDEVEHTLTENRILHGLQHQFLTSLKYSFQTKDLLVFVMEFVNGGEMFFHVTKEKVFPEYRAKFYAAEIICAVKYLHDNHVIYRDLKLENLLLDSEGHIKITDFGLCKQNLLFNDRTSTFCGTPEYLAPEVIEESPYGRAVDWWGLGVVLYEMLFGRLPFFDQNHERLFTSIITAELTFPARTKYHVSAEARLLLSGLLRKIPEERIGGGKDDAMELQIHPFFSDINWVDVENRRIPPPFVPEVTDDEDTRYFDPEFTSMEVDPALLSEVPHLSSVIEEDDNVFQEFSVTMD